MDILNKINVETKILNIMETIRYLLNEIEFNGDYEDYNLYPTNYQQYQSFSGKTLLPLNKSLEKVRPELIKMIKNCNISVDAVFRSIRNPNDIITLQIKSKDTTDIDEIFDQLIKKHDLTESLKNVDLTEGTESITCNFTKIIISDTFIESPEWIKIKSVQLIHKTRTINVFNILVQLL